MLEEVLVSNLLKFDLRALTSTCRVSKFGGQLSSDNFQLPQFKTRRRGVNFRCPGARRSCASFQLPLARSRRRSSYLQHIREPDIQAKTFNSCIFQLPIPRQPPTAAHRNDVYVLCRDPTANVETVYVLSRAHFRLSYVGIRRRSCTSRFPDAEHSTAKCRKSILGSWALRHIW